MTPTPLTQAATRLLRTITRSLQPEQAAFTAGMRPLLEHGQRLTALRDQHPAVPAFAAAVDTYEAFRAAARRHAHAMDSALTAARDTRDRLTHTQPVPIEAVDDEHDDLLLAATEQRARVADALTAAVLAATPTPAGVTS